MTEQKKERCNVGEETITVELPRQLAEDFTGLVSADARVDSGWVASEKLRHLLGLVLSSECSEHGEICQSNADHASLLSAEEPVSDA